MYAASTIVMHHRQLLTGHERRVAPEFELIREIAYESPLPPGRSADDVAQRVLSHLGIQGAYSVQGKIDPGPLIITRDRPIGSYRVTYDAAANKLKVERQCFGLAFFLEMLHRRRGYTEEHLANDLWALIVDVVVIAIVVWAITGLWMWFGISRTRKLGSLCLLGGSSLFLFLLYVL